MFDIFAHGKPKAFVHAVSTASVAMALDDAVCRFPTCAGCAGAEWDMTCTIIAMLDEDDAESLPSTSTEPKQSHRATSSSYGQHLLSLAEAHDVR